MGRVSVRDLHLRTSNILKEVEKGVVIVIERRGVPVAELRPPGRISRQEMLREIEAFSKQMPKLKTSSTKIISAMRKR